jgi:hypothetical protein
MFRPEDFAGAGGTINMPNIPVSLAPPPFLGAQPNLNNPTPVCTFCNLLIQDKNSKLIIRINN